MKNVFRIYSGAGFKVTTLSCNKEVTPLVKEVKDEFNVQVKYASAQEHVPEAEQNNQVIKEQIGAVFHSLPIAALP